MRSLTLALTLSFVALAGCASAATHAPAGMPTPPSQGAARGYVPGWEPVACKHTLAPGSKTYCGYLTVPERREVPTGRTIKVYHVVMPALNGSTSSIPVMYLTGGPGAATAGAVSLFETTTGPAGIYRQKFGATRDLIVVDQRGTNNSVPALYCTAELAPYRTQVYGADFALAASLRVQALVSAARASRARASTCRATTTTRSPPTSRTSWRYATSPASTSTARRGARG